MGLDADEGALSPEQQLVIQAVYDRFRGDGKWPTFLSVDRPLRREHGINTRAVFKSLPDSLVTKPRQGMGPTDTDELILRLPGIEICEGGREDTERFVRVLRWFAEQEVAYAPPPDGDDQMPRVTSDDVAAYLGLRRTDPEYHAALERLHAMTRLDHWGFGGSGSNQDGWFVNLGPEIWRFRDVQTVEDVTKAREDWIAEAQTDRPHFPNMTPTTYYHVRVSRKSRPQEDLVRLDLSHDELESRVLTPRREGRPIVVRGTTISMEDLAQLRISRSGQPSSALQTQPHIQKELAQRRTYATPDDWLIAKLCEDVTDDLVTEPQGRLETPQGSSQPLAPPRVAPYVDEKVTAAIRTKDKTSRLDCTKLMSLIYELNDNHARGNAYAAHALLRSILDHVPPILSCTGFTEVANNHKWGQTDRRYIKKLLDFKLQGDDALHRQISEKTDLIAVEDLPPRAWLNRLLQECADKL
jgi:hypothetical protein